MGTGCNQSEQKRKYSNDEAEAEGGGGGGRKKGAETEPSIPICGVQLKLGASERAVNDRETYEDRERQLERTRNACKHIKSKH